ncbi:MAG: DUF4255 domain-containing protein [Myxococcales bacterium]|nr:DUF4255 domain-containing protein [Myxococcales bacterium]MCB9580298.1 DUF4255 domain-containing protein [Polyangiaceae bacterium]
MADASIIKQATQALVEILKTAPGGFPVLSGPPERATGVSSSTLILYLYQVLESSTAKNSGPRRTVISSTGKAQNIVVERDPLALDLYFLIIPATKVDDDLAFLDTYQMLGEAALALHDNGVFTLGQWVSDPAVKDIKLQVTMNPLTTTQLFELWEAVNQPYRLSVSYVVRTVRIDSQLTTDTPLVSKRQMQTTEV